MTDTEGFDPSGTRCLDSCAVEDKRDRTVGEGLKITAENTDAQGKPTKVDFGVISFDGKLSGETS
jgi:hypothetical protein